MEMSQRERVMTALKGEQPDCVPFCELAIDRALAQKLMGWEEVPAETAATAIKNPYTAKESKEIASFLGLDNISYTPI